MAKQNFVILVSMKRIIPLKRLLSYFNLRKNACASALNPEGEAVCKIISMASLGPGKKKSLQSKDFKI
jgi:hypothetical protein